MKNLSSASLELINRLHAPAGVRKGAAPAMDAQDELLSRIGELGEPLAIPFVVPFLIHPRVSIARTALNAVHLLTRRLVPSDFIRLDQEMRQRSIYHSPQWSKWHDLRPEALERFPDVSEHSWVVPALASFHENGYVREAAIKRLSLL